jgi:uncharacterized membrane protein
MEIILFLAVIILLFWVGSLNSRISMLERKAGLSQSPASQPVKAFSAATAPPPPPAAHSVPQYPAAAAHGQIPHRPASSHTEESDTDTAIGWLNKIGVVAVVLGVAFFYKIAVDLGWINEWTRIIMGILAGSLLIYLGELWKSKYGSYALAISGGGVALLYFTLYAGYDFYHLFPQFLAFVLTLAVAAVSVFLAYRHASLSLGLLGFFGAYGSPLFLRGSSDQQVELFVYLTVMGVATLLILAKKYWIELLALHFIGVLADFSIWAANYSAPENTYTSVYFVVIQALLLVLGSALLVRKHYSEKTLPENLDSHLSILHVLVGAFYLISVYTLLHGQFEKLLGLLGALGGVIFYISYVWIDRLEYRKINYALSFAGSALLVLSAVWQFSGNMQALALLLLALLGVTSGCVQNREEVRIWGLFTLVAALLNTLWIPYPAEGARFLLNAKFGLMAANIGALLYTAWLFGKTKISEQERLVQSWLEVAAGVLLWFSVTWDISKLFPGKNSLVVQNANALWWVLYPLVLGFLAIIGRRKILFAVAAILSIFSLLRVLVLPYPAGHAMFANTKFVLMFLQALMLAGMARLAGRSSDGKTAEGLRLVAVILVWFSVSWEIVEYFANPENKNTRNLLLSLWWVVYSALLMYWGIFRRNRHFRKISVVLFFITVVKVFLYDLLVLDLGFLIVSLIALGVILITVSINYRKHRQKILEFLNESEQAAQTPGVIHNEIKP